MIENIYIFTLYAGFRKSDNRYVPHHKIQIHLLVLKYLDDAILVGFALFSIGG